MPFLSRRLVLKILGLGTARLGLPTIARKEIDGLSERAGSGGGESKENATLVSWSDTHDRVWLSGDCWANPMEDWQVVDGAAECSVAAANRNIHLLTHQISNPKGPLEISVVLSQIEIKKKDLGAGFELGIRSDLNEHRSNSFAGGGIAAGVVDGKLVVGRKSQAFDGLANPKNLTLKLVGTPNGEQYELTLTAVNSDGEELGRLSASVAGASVLGNVAIVNNYGRGNKGKAGNGGRYRFNDWAVSGAAFTVTEENRFGPILWSMYTLSDSRGDEGFVMKLSALTGPLGKQDNKDIELFVQNDGQWKSLGTAALDEDAWTATFRIANWDEKTETPYKVVYHQRHRSGKQTESSWSGNIKANPVGRPLRLGALTCQKDYGFPYAPVAENLIKLDPDMLYFSGDQLYENHGGYGLIRDPADRAILNYLRKYYMHGWSFRHAIRAGGFQTKSACLMSIDQSTDFPIPESSSMDSATLFMSMPSEIQKSVPKRIAMNWLIKKRADSVWSQSTPRRRPIISMRSDFSSMQPTASRLTSSRVGP